VGSVRPENWALELFRTAPLAVGFSAEEVPQNKCLLCLIWYGMHGSITLFLSYLKQVPSFCFPRYSFLVYLLGSSALALAWVSKVCSRKFGEEQENISRDGKPCNKAPVQLRSAGFSLGSASRG